MDGKLHIDMFPQLNSGLSKMRELTKKQPNFLHEKERCYKTEAHSFFTTFYNLNWDANDKILAEEVATFFNNRRHVYYKIGNLNEPLKRVLKFSMTMYIKIRIKPIIGALL